MRAIRTGMEIDWAKPDWAYMLGVIHGDGHIADRSVEIVVGHGDANYAEIIRTILERLGLSPKIYNDRSVSRLRVNSKSLANTLRPLKQNQHWSWPDSLDWASYVAGVIDTDGCVTTGRQIVIVLKRTGNLTRLAHQLTTLGIRPLTASDKCGKYKGTPYATERLAITGTDRILFVAQHIIIRHPRKMARLQKILAEIAEGRSRVPLCKRVGNWIEKEGPKTWREIAAEFNLPHKQRDSVLGMLRTHFTLETIPAETKFRVIGISKKEQNAIAQFPI